MDSKGVITAKKVGTCKITVTSKTNNKKKATITVKVVKGKVKSLSLSSSSLSVDVGSKATLTYTAKTSGKNPNKNVVWTSSNTSVATVNQKGVVTAKKAGTTTIKITSTDGTKKTAKCTVTVSEPFSASEAEKNISYTLQDTGSGVVAILKNNNSFGIGIEAKLVYYKDGSMIGISTDWNYAFESGRECALCFYAPYDSDYNTLDYDSYKISFTVEKMSDNIVANAGKINIVSDMGENVIVQATNNSGTTFEFINVRCVFYDSNGNAIGYDEIYAECTTAGSTSYYTFYFPYDDNYKTITPASYKIYVNNAYIYTWMQ